MKKNPLSALKQKRVVVLADLFIDTLVPLPEWAASADRLFKIAEQGGGNLPVGKVEVRLGGNAANLAVALGRLGAQVDLITQTDPLGAHLLRRAARGSRVGMRGVRVGDEASATVALESPEANIMLSHSGPFSEFGPDRLRWRDWRMLEKADAVAVVNWAQNLEGTPLLKQLATRLGGQGKLLYLDTGDPRNRRSDAHRLLEEKEIWQGLDVWALNENELEHFSGAPVDHDLVAAQELSRRLDVRLDVHTRKWAAAVYGENVVHVEAHSTPARRLTGAGDAWNAGNLAGHLLGWSDRGRLQLAHDVANVYTTSEQGIPPRAKEVVQSV